MLEIIPRCRGNPARQPLSRLDFVRRARVLSIALAAGAALGLVACGGGGDANLLPGDTASEINANLDRVEELAGEGDCVGASEAAQSVSLQVEELGGVDAQLKQALQEGAARLSEVVASCEEATTEEETVPAIEEAEEPEAEEKEKEKPEKPADDEAEEPAAEETLPPQAEGEAKGHEKQEEEAPPAETGGGTPSGGVGPGTPAEGE
jgi:septal ring-binding cell division protein DamX